MAAHSRFGGSVLDRVMACPGSVALSSAMPNEETEYAAEGTLLHDAGAAALEAWLAGKSRSAKVTRLLKTLTDEQRDVIGAWTNLVRTETDLLDLHSPATLLVEQRFALTGLHQEFFGTADAVIYNNRSLRVFDLKCGRGVDVQADKAGKVNPQLGFYALGALAAIGWNVSRNGIVPPAGVELTDIEVAICQPRSGGVKRRSVTVEELSNLAVRAVQAADLADTDNAPLQAGDHCRFCPARPICPALRAQAMESARVDFESGAVQSPASMSPDELAKALRDADLIETWVKALREHAKAELERGRALPGWKLVERAGNRKWRDEHAAYEALRDVLDEDEIVEQSLRSPAQIERLLKKADRLDVLDELIERKTSSVTLAPDTDKRREARVGAAADFAQ